MNSQASSQADFTTIASIILQKGSGDNNSSVTSDINSLKADYSNDAKMDSIINSLSSKNNSESTSDSTELNSLSTAASAVSSADTELNSLSGFVHKNVKTPPVNIFPNYWVKQTSYGPHKDAPTFHVPVEQGKEYTLSFKIADGTDNANLDIRAASSWNIADEWGDIVENDGGASGNNSIYHITFTVPKSGNMPINFMFCRQASAMSAGINTIMIQRITMTQTDSYVPYQNCDNSNQSLADVTGDAGMDAKAMFGKL